VMAREATELTCQELVELVTDYLEDTLAPFDRDALERHLADCRFCRAYVEQMRLAIELTGMPELASPSPPSEELLAAFRTWRRARA
jgi:predicted anti-sigma-YlaC factor YlaD